MSSSIYIKSNRRFVSEQQSGYWVVNWNNQTSPHQLLLLQIMFLCYKRWLLRSIRLLWKMETKIFVMLLLRLSPCRIWKIFYLRQTEQVFSTIWRGSWSIVAAIAFPRRQKTNVNKVCFPTFFIKNLNINISWGDTSAAHPTKYQIISIFKEDICIYWL